VEVDVGIGEPAGDTTQRTRFIGKPTTNDSRSSATTMPVRAIAHRFQPFIRHERVDDTLASPVAGVGDPDW
jgi:hypothetical protein